MAILVTKHEAARRQLDYAIQMHFQDQDSLVVHTIASAARGILRDLAKQRGTHLSDVWPRAARSVLSKLSKLDGHQISEDWFHRNNREIKKWVYGHSNRAANFLKHANRDPRSALPESKMDNDAVLLEACALYTELGLEGTPEMKAFTRWHLAVYPGVPEDILVASTGEEIHKMPRELQLQLGEFLIDFETDETVGQKDIE